MAATLLWYDLETFGVNPRWDRIGQFAALRTDHRFREVGDPIVVYCKLTPDYVPDPESCLITGITPRFVEEHGLSDASLAARVEQEMRVPATCVVGFNNLSFDDEFIRSLLFRNFYDPYRREYEDGNTRWDILDLVRMTHDLRPDGIDWVDDENGKPIFRLAELAAANRIGHDRAHDALSDVRATVKLAELVHEKQPRLFSYFFKLRKKEQVRRIVNLQSPQLVLYTSSLFTRPGGCTTVVYPLSTNPARQNEIIAYDLRNDPGAWLDLDVAELHRRVFSPSSELEEGERLRFTGIRINRCPAVAPLRTLTPQRAEALGLDVEACKRNAEKLRTHPDLVRKIRAVYLEESGGPDRPKDPELRIYSDGFFGDEDLATFQRIHDADPAALIAAPPQFVDQRGPELLRRYLGRNYFDLLSETERGKWISFCASRLLAPEIDTVLDFPGYKRKVETLLGRTDTPASHKPVLRDLLDYAKLLEERVLDYR
jgi:exodeoxyribonuclease I